MPDNPPQGDGSRYESDPFDPWSEGDDDPGLASMTDEEIDRFAENVKRRMEQRRKQQEPPPQQP
jgi:hypothetical protein